MAIDASPTHDRDDRRPRWPPPIRWLAGPAPSAIADDRSTGVTHDSRAVVARRRLFAACAAAHLDGHDYAAAAVEAGAVGAARRPRARRRVAVAQVVVDDTRRAIGPLAAARPRPPEPRAARSSASPAPTARRRPRSCWPPIFEAGRVTTGDRSARCAAPARPPRRPSCRHCSPAFRDDGVGRVVMEVSSHALALHRVDGTGSTRPCSPTSAATTSTSTARPRSTSGPRRGCSAPASRRSASSTSTTRTAGCSPTPPTIADRAAYSRSTTSSDLEVTADRALASRWRGQRVACRSAGAST